MLLLLATQGYFWVQKLPLRHLTAWTFVIFAVLLTTQAAQRAVYLKTGAGSGTTLPCMTAKQNYKYVNDVHKA